MIVVSSSAVMRCTVPGGKWKAAPGPTTSLFSIRSPGAAELDLRAALEHVPGLVLLLVELEAERLARADEEDLAGVVVGLRPDQLVAPGLVHLLGLRRKLVEPAEVR